MNEIEIKARSLARKLRLHSVVAKVRHAVNPNRPIEMRVKNFLQDAVQSGDTVWDVGANVGDFTELFCKWAGEHGRVVAFEPNSEAGAQIRERIKDYPGLKVENVALGSREEQATLLVGAYSRWGHIGERPEPGTTSIPIHVTTGDAVSARLGNPDVVKIDVEGFEEEVLHGLDRTLSSVRMVIVEVHFRALESRGQANAPIRIAKFIGGKGFKIHWIDSNHLAGQRISA